MKRVKRKKHNQVFSFYCNKILGRKRERRKREFKFEYNLPTMLPM